MPDTPKRVRCIENRSGDRQRKPGLPKPGEALDRESRSAAFIKLSDIARQVIVQNENAHPKPEQTDHLVETSGGARRGFGVVNPDEPENLHHPVPDRKSTRL